MLRNKIFYKILQQRSSCISHSYHDIEESKSPLVRQHELRPSIDIFFNFRQSRFLKIQRVESPSSNTEKLKLVTLNLYSEQAHKYTSQLFIIRTEFFKKMGTKMDSQMTNPKKC